MIVISGALVLVALVLLVLGLTMTDLDFVYGSIGVSLVSFVFLVIGILQRRGEQKPAAAGPEVTEGASAPQVSDDAAPARVPATATVPAIPAKTGGRGPVPVVEDVHDDEGLEPGGGTVLVVPGRPRYHVDGCRYLTGKAAEPIDVLDAREDGFSPCGVCKPDAALEALYGSELEPVDEVVEEEVVEEPAPAPRKRGGSRAARGSTAIVAPAPEAPADDDTELVPVVEPVPAVPASPRKRAAAAAGPGGSTTAPAKSGPRPKVVVIPDRGRFHTPVCRFVRGTLGTEELSRTAATKQGYKACGVCKP